MYVEWLCTVGSCCPNLCGVGFGSHYPWRPIPLLGMRPPPNQAVGERRPQAEFLSEAFSVAVFSIPEEVAAVRAGKITLRCRALLFKPLWPRLGLAVPLEAHTSLDIRPPPTKTSGERSPSLGFLRIANLSS